MDIERTAKQVQSITGLIGIVGGLLAAIAALNQQLRDAIEVFTPFGVGSLAVAATVLLIAGAAMFASGRRKASRLLDPDALRLEPGNPEHLIGRGDDVRLLREKCAARPLVFLIGDSGTGKTALVQAGLIPAAGQEGHFLPVYLDMADLDWEAGPLDSLADRFWRNLSADERKALGAEKPPARNALPALLAGCYAALGRIPLVILDQIDDYQLRHRDRFFPPSTRRWLAASEVLPQNRFWAMLAELLGARRLHLLLVTRSDNADGLESLRLSPEPMVVRLDPLPAGFALRVIDQLTQSPAGASPVIEAPERGWERLRIRLADDLERGGAVLPQQMKLALLGLARLKPLSVAGYERAGGIAGLEARYIEGALARAAARASLAVADVRAAVLSLVEREGPRRMPPRSTDELAGLLPGGRGAKLAPALEALEDANILRRREADGTAAWQLDHDYLARGILAVEANADRWKALLVRRAQEYADAGGNRRARRLARLSLREQLGLLFARLRGRLRYGAQRGFAVRCAAPYAVMAALFAVLSGASAGVIEMARSEAVLASLAPGELMTTPEYMALGEIAQAGPFTRAYFAARLLTDPAYAEHAMRKPEPIARAIFGLDEEGAGFIVDWAIAPSLEDADPSSIHAAASLLERMPASAQERLPPELAAILDQPDSKGLLRREKITVAGAGMAPGEVLGEQDALEALERLKSGRGQVGIVADQLRVNAAEIYAAASHRQPAESLPAALATLRDELRASRGYLNAVAVFARLYAGLAPRLPPEARGQIVGDLIEEMRAHRGHGEVLQVLSLAEQYAARTLPSELGRQFGPALVDELSAARGDPGAVISIAMAIASTVPPPADERTAAARIVREQLDRSKGTGVLVGWLAETYATLTLAEPKDLNGRAEALGAVKEELSRTTTSRQIDRSLRGFFEACGLSECFGLFASTVLDATVALPFDSRAALVVELLKVPSSTRSRLTEALLARLRAEPGAEPAGLPDGDLWAVVAWADARGLEPDEPLHLDRLFAVVPQ